MTCGPGGCTASTEIGALVTYISIFAFGMWLIARECAWWWQPLPDQMQAQMLRELPMLIADQKSMREIRTLTDELRRGTKRLIRELYGDHKP